MNSVEKERWYSCVSCGATFMSESELDVRIITHPQFDMFATEYTDHHIIFGGGYRRQNGR